MSIDSDVDPSEVSTAKRKPSRSWLLIDAAGNSTMLNVDSYAIIRRVHIYARDLRVFESSISSPLSIRTREGAIVLNLEHIKVIITADEVLLREPLNENVIPVAKEFERRLGVENRERRGQPDGKEDSGAEVDAEKDESPFEFRALEVALEAICSFLAARTTELEKSGYPALNELASKVKDELQLWLEDDDDLGDLCLSRKIATTSSPVSDSDEQINSYPTSPTIGAKISRAKSHLVRSATVRGDDQNDVEEVEMLLEAHYMQIDRTLNKLAELREYLDDTEDYINFQLASSRNKLIEFEVIITAGSVCISVYSLVVGILSTNIPFSWNTKEHMFKWVVSATATLCAIFFVIIISYARYKKLVGN